jgi:murein DD-endopeptidase MepM/ murein hydrolase activator NlpD
VTSSRPVRISALVIAAVLALAALAGVIHDRIISARRAGEAPAARAAEAPTASAAPALKADEIVIEKGQSLAKILSRRGFTNPEIDRLRTEVKTQVKPPVDLGKIVAGRTLRFRTDAGGTVRIIEYPIDADGFLRIAREGPGFKAERIDYAFETRIGHVFGAIEDNPFNAVTEKGESAALAVTMTDLFAWDIDFYTELRSGDSFRMIVEKRFLDGIFADYGNILAAEFICQGKRFEAFRYDIPDPAKPGATKADYYDREGRSVRKEFLRSPLPYAQITSRFSSSRLHPVRKVYRAHYGVDYGAPVGIPVQATADGMVIAAGWNGAAGNMVHIRHANNYETMYLHLSRIYVRKGDRVSGGKTIVGLVGSTGESTGPHLDYRIKQGGSYVNPLSWKFQPQSPLPAEYKEGFTARVSGYDFLLDAPLWVSRRPTFGFAGF